MKTVRHVRRLRCSGVFVASFWEITSSVCVNCIRMAGEAKLLPCPCRCEGVCRVSGTAPSTTRRPSHLPGVAPSFLPIPLMERHSLYSTVTPITPYCAVPSPVQYRSVPVLWRPSLICTVASLSSSPSATVSPPSPSRHAVSRPWHYRHGPHTFIKCYLSSVDNESRSLFSHLTSGSCNRLSTAMTGHYTPVAAYLPHA